MILAIDLGNSNIKVGFVSKRDIISEERLMTDHNKTSMEYALMITSVMDFYNIRKEDFEGAIISSVVPPLTGVISTAVKKVLGIEPLIVSGEMKMSIDLSKTPMPELLGADIIIGAEAAYDIYGDNVIVINMGTATTITSIGKNGRFEGGVILPGLKTSIKSLSSGASQLPEIDLSLPGKVATIETMESMTSGLIYGNAAAIDGLIGRMEDELKASCSLVATGGLARFVIPYCKRKITIDDKLLMKGLLLLYEKNETVNLVL